jgi:hypothetical protein
MCGSWLKTFRRGFWEVINPDVIRICCCYFENSWAGRGGGVVERSSVAGIVTVRALSVQGSNPYRDNRWGFRSWGKPEILQRHEMSQFFRISVHPASSLLCSLRLTTYLDPVQRLRMNGAKGAQSFQKFRRHLKILDARRMTWSEFHIEYPQAVGATVHNLVSLPIWYPGFVHPWVEPYFQSLRIYNKDRWVFVC